MTPTSEVEIIRRIGRMSAGRSGRSVIKGIGDDCAVIRPTPNSDLVFTTDFLIQDHHFTLATHKPEAIGHKALARSLSDLAAMGSEPLFCLVSLALPKPLTGKWVDKFYKGLLALADQYRITLAGGDLSKLDKVVVDVMCCGRVPRGAALLRSSAKPGHAVYVTGALGSAAQSGWQRAPEPRIEAGLKLRGLASAAMDLSDGLSLDLARLCTESEVSAVISAAALPVAPRANLHQALNGGEDYELLFTAPPTVKIPKRIGKLPLTKIGSITPGKPGQVRMDGRLLPPAGYDHFA